jgi:hypothetical protein
MLALFFRVGFGALMPTAAFCLLFWMLGLGVAMYQFCWFLVGRERIVLSPSRLSIKHEVFGMGRIREYDKEHIRDLRVSTMPYKRAFGSRASFHDRVVGGGVIAFDYGPATVRFGAGLEEAEAKSILVQIQSRGFGA